MAQALHLRTPPQWIEGESGLSARLFHREVRIHREDARPDLHGKPQPSNPMRLSDRHRYPAWCALPLIVLLVGGFQTTLLHAQASSAVGLVVGALPQVRETIPPGPAALDPQILCSPRLAGWSCPAEVTRIAEELGFTLHSRNFTHVCPGDSRSCRLVAARSLLHFTEPEVRGNRGSVMLDVWWQTDNRARPVGHRRARLTLARESTGWKVTRTEPILAADP